MLVLVTVGVAVLITVGVFVGVLVNVGVGVLVGVPVGVAVLVTVGVRVGVLVGCGVGVALEVVEKASTSLTRARFDVFPLILTLPLTRTPFTFVSAAPVNVNV